MDGSESLLLGCHLSIARGFVAAVDEAERLGNTALQIFSHNAMTWRMKEILPDSAAAFRDRRSASSIRYVVIHAMYLVNLASPDDALHARSVEAMISEVERAARLGIDRVVLHLGAHKGAGRDIGLERVVMALDRIVESEVFRESDGIRLLLENAAGTGTAIGSTFAEIAEICAQLRDARRIGVCLDTCHAHAAGYDLRSRRAVDETLDVFDRAIGLERLDLIHLNDAKAPLGSRRDRHEHIGLGEIGESGIASVLRASPLRRLPFLLETPKEIDGRPDADSINLARVRTLRDEGATS